MSQDQIIRLTRASAFGKDFDQNVYVMKHLQELTALPYPMLLGTSRKVHRQDPGPAGDGTDGRDWDDCVAGVLAGCTIVRVHDVKPIVRMCKMADALRPEK